MIKTHTCYSSTNSVRSFICRPCLSVRCCDLGHVLMSPLTLQRNVLCLSIHSSGCTCLRLNAGCRTRCKLHISPSACCLLPPPVSTCPCLSALIPNNLAKLILTLLFHHCRARRQSCKWIRTTLDKHWTLFTGWWLPSSMCLNFVRSQCANVSLSIGPVSAGDSDGCVQRRNLLLIR